MFGSMEVTQRPAAPVPVEKTRNTADTVPWAAFGVAFTAFPISVIAISEIMKPKPEGQQREETEAGTDGLVRTHTCIGTHAGAHMHWHTCIGTHALAHMQGHKFVGPAGCWLL